MTMAWIISGNNLLKADKPAVILGIWNPFDFCGCVDAHLFYLIILFKSVWHENVSALSVLMQMAGQGQVLAVWEFILF